MNLIQRILIPFTVILLLCTHCTSNETSSSKNPEELIWNSIVEKYSGGNSKQYLTVEQFSKFIKANQKCNKNQIPSSSYVVDVSTGSTLPKESVCESSELSFLKGTNSKSNISYQNVTQFCSQILYLIDTTNCCNPPSNIKAPNVIDISSGNSVISSNHNQANSHKFLQQELLAEDRGLDVKKKPSPAEVWGYGILLVTLISMSSLAGVSVMPFMGKKMYKNILTVLIGLAVGSLTGSSVFHLIPQAYGLLDQDSEHSYLYTSLVICGGIWMFFMVERFLKIIMDHKERKDKRWKHDRISSVYSSTPENSTISMLVENGDKVGNGTESVGSENRRTSICSPANTGAIYECQEQAIKASFGHQEKPKCNGHEHIVNFEQGKDSVIATVAWMIVFGDGLHNFIDGLSIGAAFNESILTGVSISVAVLCEELPHELGDFAVLLNAGMSVKQALLYNFLSACTCYLGLAIGIFLGEVEASQYIFGLAGGMFLYISLVDMMPEMNEVAEESSKVSVKRALFVLCLQNLGIFIGVSALFSLAMFQEHIQF